MIVIPNLLTLSRIFSIPLICICFYVQHTIVQFSGVVLFLLACITDFLDGYLARQWRQVSAFGRFLDPVADKLLISITLLMLCGFGIVSEIHLVAAAVILAREIMVSGLREFLAQGQIIVPVTGFAKCKTAIQMVSIFFLFQHAMFPSKDYMYYFGIIFLWIAAFMTLVTGCKYLNIGISHILNDDHSRSE